MDGIRWVLDPDGHPPAGQPLYDEPIGLVARRDLSRTVGITTVTAAASTPRPKHSSATSTGPCPMDRWSVDTNLAHAVDEARAQGYRVFVGEIAAVATAEQAPEAGRLRCLPRRPGRQRRLHGLRVVGRWLARLVDPPGGAAEITRRHPPAATPGLRGAGHTTAGA